MIPSPHDRFHIRQGKLIPAVPWDYPPVGGLTRQAVLEGLVEEEGVFAVQVDGALVMGQWLARGYVGSCQEVGQLVHRH